MSVDSAAWALLPMKDLVQAKSRLGGVLASHERRALAQAMAEDVLTALTACEGLAGILLVSDDPGAELLANKYGVEMLPESELGASGLNEVITAACDLLARRGVDSIAVVHGDLPLLTAAELGQLLAERTRSGADVVIAPDRRRDGTNVLVTAAGARPRFRYGPGSCEAHRDEAQAAGLTCCQVELPGAGLDVDQPADLIDLWQQCQRAGSRGYTCSFLARPEITRRLSALAEAGDPGREVL